VVTHGVIEMRIGIDGHEYDIDLNSAYVTVYKGSRFLFHLEGMYTLTETIKLIQMYWIGYNQGRIHDEIYGPDHVN